nr:nucleotide-binding alpha-beta plait domain-containing protein [Tanacetum cinerariifolium]
MAHTVNGEFLRDEDRRGDEEVGGYGHLHDDEINRLARGGKQRGHIAAGVAGAGTRRRVPTIRTTRMRMAMAILSCVIYGTHLFAGDCRWGRNPLRAFPSDKSPGKAPNCDRRSKEDGIHNISTSIFVTNFPDETNAKELWKFGNQYRNVIDAFIPDRRSKIGKRFGFIRFIKPWSSSFDFVFSSEIFKSLSFYLDRLCHLAILCLNHHAHTLHHLESLLTISFDRLDILKEDLEYQSLQKSLSLCLSFLDS